MLASLSRQLLTELETLQHRHRIRNCAAVDGSSRIHLVLDGEPVTSFCSNDYLGLASHPTVVQAAVQAAKRVGFGAGASRLVSGTFPDHLALEAALARLVGCDTALLFPSGYQANLAAIATLANSSDLVVADRAIHASLLDATRLSRAKLAIYPHLDVARARRLLQTFGPRARRRFLLTESLFSMDGDFAPLPELARAAADHDAALLVDEAHALGTLPAHRAGLCAASGIRPDILIGTFGKALGTIGAFVAGTATLRSYLLNHARPFLFTTAPPPALAAATRAAVDLLLSPEGDALRSQLHANVAHLRGLLDLPADPPCSPIFPLIVGSDQAALAAAAQLRAAGFLVTPIRPPTVREGTSRLRLTVSALHSHAEIDSLAALLPRPIDRRRTVSLPVSPLPSASAAGPPPSATLAPPHRGIVILGTDTGVGKSTLAVALLHLLTRRGLRPIPWKPVETGADPEPRDALRLLAAASRPDLPLNLVCPFAFPAPLAPLAAAEQAGQTLTLAGLLAGAASAATRGSPLIVETAGGLLSPYTEALTSADLAAALRLPVLLVARNALGTVNHTALALAELRRRALPLTGLILVDTDQRPAPDRRLNAPLLARTTGLTPLGVLPYSPSPRPEDLADLLEASVRLQPVLEVLI